MNFAGAWPLPMKVMQPLAYARSPKTVKRKLVKPAKKTTPESTMAFKLVGIRPQRRSGSSYDKKLTINRNRKSSPWPMLMIQQSTKIFGEIPADNYDRSNEFGMPKPGYFFEKSEVEISPFNNIFREERYSLRAFFNDLSNNAFSQNTRFRRDTNEQQDKDEEVESSDQTENVSRLLTILNRNQEDPLRKENFGHRSKRQIQEGKAPEEIKELEQVETKKVTDDDLKKRGKGRRNSGYTPVFQECNDTAASEISDLNAPPSPPERRFTLQEYSRNGPQFFKDIDTLPKRNPPIINRQRSEDSQIPPSVPPAVDEEVVEPPKETAETSKDSRNATYINLQDHQKGAQDGIIPKDANGYPLDIPPYNPDIIPYVDVPDYSDQREESLDKDDRRVAKEKYVDYTDDDADVIDPGLTLKSDKRSEKIIVSDDEVSDKDEAPEGPNDSKPRDAEEVKEREEVEEEEDGNSRVSSDGENVEEEKENEETNSKDIRHSENDDLKDFEPVHFDINEYKKPFNLEELFKDIEKDAHKAQEKNKTKVRDVNEHQSSKNIPVRDDSHEAISDAFGKYQNDGDSKLSTFEDPGKKENHEKTIPPNFFEEFERVFGPASSEKPFTGYFDTEDNKEGLSESPEGLVENDEEKYPYASENTYERLFGNEDEGNNDKNTDTYYKPHSEDFHGDKKSQEPAEAEEEPSDESLREAYKTLATILDGKDDISRLDPDVAQKAKKEGKMPSRYKNYWTLEYGTPMKEGKT